MSSQSACFSPAVWMSCRIVHTSMVPSSLASRCGTFSLAACSGVSGSLCDPAPASRGEKGSDRWRRAISISAALCVQSACEKTDARGEIRGAREETRDETRSNSAEREERSEKRGASSERRGEARRESSLAAAQDAPLLRQDSCGAPQPLRILCQPRRDWRK